MKTPQQKVKGIKMGEKLKERDPEDLPGPGNYELKSKIQEGPQYQCSPREITNTMIILDLDNMKHRNSKQRESKWEKS
ncbi:MAG: hypothetical protein IPK55_11425 [Streptococcus sp.]|nr:hypothetical protein [Streptococcus sp.]